MAIYLIDKKGGELTPCTLKSGKGEEPEYQCAREAIGYRLEKKEKDTFLIIGNQSLPIPSDAPRHDYYVVRDEKGTLRLLSERDETTLFSSIPGKRTYFIDLFTGVISSPVPPAPPPSHPVSEKPKGCEGAKTGADLKKCQAGKAGGKGAPTSAEESKLGPIAGVAGGVLWHGSDSPWKWGIVGGVGWPFRASLGGTGVYDTERWGVSVSAKGVYGRQLTGELEGNGFFKVGDSWRAGAGAAAALDGSRRGQIFFGYRKTPPGDSPLRPADHRSMADTHALRLAIEAQTLMGEASRKIAEAEKMPAGSPELKKAVGEIRSLLSKAQVAAGKSVAWQVQGGVKHDLPDTSKLVAALGPLETRAVAAVTPPPSPKPAPQPEKAKPAQPQPPKPAAVEPKPAPEPKLEPPSDTGEKDLQKLTREIKPIRDEFLTLMASILRLREGEEAKSLDVDDSSLIRIKGDLAKIDDSTLLGRLETQLTALQARAKALDTLLTSLGSYIKGRETVEAAKDLTAKIVGLLTAVKERKLAVEGSKAPAGPTRVDSALLPTEIQGILTKLGIPPEIVIVKDGTGKVVGVDLRKITDERLAEAVKTKLPNESDLQALEFTISRLRWKEDWASSKDPLIRSCRAFLGRVDGKIRDRQMELADAGEKAKQEEARKTGEEARKRAEKEAEARKAEEAKQRAAEAEAEAKRRAAEAEAATRAEAARREAEVRKKAAESDPARLKADLGKEGTKVADFFYFDPAKEKNFPVTYFRMTRDPSQWNDKEKIDEFAKLLVRLHKTYLDRQINLAFLNMENHAGGTGEVKKFLTAVVNNSSSKKELKPIWGHFRFTSKTEEGTTPGTIDFVLTDPALPIDDFYPQLVGLGKDVLSRKSKGEAVDPAKFRAEKAAAAATKAKLEAEFKKRIAALKEKGESLASEAESLLRGLQTKPYTLSLLQETRIKLETLPNDLQSPLKKLEELDAEAGKINKEVNGYLTQGIPLEVADPSDMIQAFRDRAEAAYAGIRDLRFQVALELGESTLPTRGRDFNPKGALAELKLVLGKKLGPLPVRLRQNEGEGYLLFVKYKSPAEAARIAKGVAILMSQTSYSMTIGVISPDAEAVASAKEALGPFKFASQKDSYPSPALQKDHALILAIFPRPDDTFPPPTRFMSRLGKELEKRGWEGL